MEPDELDADVVDIGAVADALVADVDAVGPIVPVPG